MFLFLNFFSNVPGGLRLGATVINRPGVAGAILQTPPQGPRYLGKYKSSQ